MEGEFSAIVDSEYTKAPNVDLDHGDPAVFVTEVSRSGARFKIVVRSEDPWV